MPGRPARLCHQQGKAKGNPATRRELEPNVGINCNDPGFVALKVCLVPVSEAGRLRSWASGVAGSGQGVNLWVPLPSGALAFLFYCQQGKEAKRLSRGKSEWGARSLSLCPGLQALRWDSKMQEPKAK